jgi:hypothetical protein
MAPPRGRLLPHRQAFHETDTAHPAAGLLRERAGEADGLVRRAGSGAEPPGRRAASPPSAGGAHELRLADAPSRRGRHSQGAVGGRGRHSQGAVLVGGSRGLRYASPFALAVGHKPRRDALCLSAAPAPRQAGPPSRRAIWPKRAAVSRLLARNLKRDLTRFENR